MKTIFAVGAVVFLLLSTVCFGRGALPSVATCRVSCTVAPLAEWRQTTPSTVDTSRSAQAAAEDIGLSSPVFHTNGYVKVSVDSTADGQSGFPANRPALAAAGAFEWPGFEVFPADVASTSSGLNGPAVEVIVSVEPASAAGQGPVRILTACWSS